MEKCENCTELMEKVVRMDNNLENLRSVFDENVDISNKNFDEIWENMDKIGRFLEAYQRRERAISACIFGAFLISCGILYKKHKDKKDENKQK